MGLAPSEFYRLLYSELVLILEGRRERIAREARARREESAWLGSIFLAPHTPKGRDPITPAELMGRKPRQKPARRFATMEESAAAWFAEHRAKSKPKELTDGK